MHFSDGDSWFPQVAATHGYWLRDEKKGGWPDGRGSG
jgi:hypothetical protein